MLPTWGDKWNKKWGVGPEIFTPENARAYGDWLARRYTDSRSSGSLAATDRSKTKSTSRIVRGLAEGLREGDGGSHLITMHTWGPHATSEYVHDEGWLDFHTCQSGHARNSANWQFIEADYARTPTRPCMERSRATRIWRTRSSTWMAATWTTGTPAKPFTGRCSRAHGHTYGCNPVWQMWHPGRATPIWPRRPWSEAIHLPGSSQMQHARALLLSRPYLDRIPDQSLIVSDVGTGTHHVQATRDRQGT